MHYAPDVSLDPYYKACEPDTRSEVAIPLHVESDLIGVFTASHCELDAFSIAQLRLLQGLCSHLAVAVHNARRFHDEREQRELMSREAEEARSIQEALLPRSSPLIPGFRVSGLSTPAGAIGGDWYDFIPLENGRWGLVLADVLGKGTAAALLMSATRGMLRSLASTGSGRGEVLTRLNKLMVEDFPCGRFVTYGLRGIDPGTRKLRVASAGYFARSWWTRKAIAGSPIKMACLSVSQLASFPRRRLRWGRRPALPFTPTESPKLPSTLAKSTALSGCSQRCSHLTRRPKACCWM